MLLSLLLSSLCCVVVVMCGGFCANRQGVFAFLTCDSLSVGILCGSGVVQYS